MPDSPAQGTQTLVRTSVQLPQDQMAWLEARARRSQSRSVAQEVRALIAAAMQAEEREAIPA